MKEIELSKGTANFWSQIISYLVSCLIIILLMLPFFDKKSLIITAFAFLVFFIWFLVDTKQKILRALPNDFSYEIASLSDYPLVNFTWLEQTTEALESVGFSHLMDYKLTTGLGFARCFFHPQSYCYTEVNEVFTPTGESYIKQASITTFFTNNWVLSTTNRSPQLTDSIPYGFWRNPKTIRLYYPDTSLKELWDKHQEWMQAMISNLNITLETDLSWENYVQKQQEATIYRKKMVKNKILLLAMIEVTLFEINPKFQWLGDYQRYVNSSRN